MCRCALGRRPRLAPSHPCWRAGRGPPGPSASVLGRVSAVPGPLLCVGVRRGVGVKARPSLDCPGLAILSSTRWSWERAEGWGEASGRIMAEAGAEAACPPRTGGRRERRELGGSWFSEHPPPPRPVGPRSFNDPLKSYHQCSLRASLPGPGDTVMHKAGPENTQSRSSVAWVATDSDQESQSGGPGERPEEAGAPCQRHCGRRL